MRIVVLQHQLINFDYAYLCITWGVPARAPPGSVYPYNSPTQKNKVIFYETLKQSSRTSSVVYLVTV